MVYVYAIFEPSGKRFDTLHGVGDAPAYVQLSDGIGVAWSEVAGAVARPTPDNVWRHEQVVEAIMRAHAVLPVRFGTVLRDVDALDALVERNRERLCEGLRRVRDCVELGVRVLLPNEAGTASEVPDDSSGRAYLLARLREEQARRDHETFARETAARLHAQFSSRAADSTLRVFPNPPFLMAGAYLVPRDRTDEFRRCVTAAGEAEPSLRLLCTGPWPPYHFVPELALPEVQRA